MGGKVENPLRPDFFYRSEQVIVEQINRVATQLTLEPLKAPEILIGTKQKMHLVTVFQESTHEVRAHKARSASHQATHSDLEATGSFR